jgi:hypothetical protein
MIRLINGATIPQIYCPFDFAISPFIGAMHEGSMKWACDMELVIRGSEAYNRLADCLGETLAACALPFAERDVLQLSGDFILWLVFHDDYVDKTRQGYDSNRLARLHAQLFAVLDGQPLESAEPVAIALQDICQRVAAQSNGEVWPKRFACAVKNYLQSNGIANHQISYVNGGLFFAKENKEHDPSNLVIILRDELGSSWQEVVNRVIDMANREAI